MSEHKQRIAVKGHTVDVTLRRDGTARIEYGMQVPPGPGDEDCVVTDAQGHVVGGPAGRQKPVASVEVHADPRIAAVAQHAPVAGMIFDRIAALFRGRSERR